MGFAPQGRVIRDESGGVEVGDLVSLLGKARFTDLVEVPWRDGERVKVPVW